MRKYVQAPSRLRRQEGRREATMSKFLGNLLKARPKHRRYITQHARELAFALEDGTFLSNYWT
jgi:hypothetical protein